MELCHICGVGKIIQDPEWLCNNCGAVVNKPEEYGLSQAYYPRDDKPRQSAAPDSIGGAKIRPKGGKIVGIEAEDPITDSTVIRPSYDNINMYDLIFSYIRQSFNLNDYICEEAKRLFRKCEKRQRKTFHLSEYVGACIYIAILQSDGKTRYGRRKYRDKYRYRKRYITSEEVAEKLNGTLSTVMVNHIKYRDVKPSRIRRCAEELARELRLPKSTCSKIPIDPAIEKIFNHQLEAVGFAMASIIIDKLDLRNTTRVKPFDKVWLAFARYIGRIDRTSLLKTSNILTNKGHLREPNVIAAAFIYNVFKHRKNITIRAIRKAAGCGDKSLQKVLKILYS